MIVLQARSLNNKLPDGMLRAIFMTLTEGPVATIRYRLGTLKKWTAWAKELEPAESALRESMRPSVRGVVGNKRIKLLQRIAESLSWPDRSLFDEMAAGFMLAGYMRNTGVFSPDAKPATVTEDEFWLGAQHMRQALWDKVESHPLQTYSQDLWDLTMEEASPNKRWLEGPLAKESLDSLFEAPTGRKRAKNAFSPKPFGTGLRGTNSTLGPVEGSKMLLLPRMA